MGITCKVGVHSWQGCKCSKCGKTKGEGHIWDAGKCKICGKVDFCKVNEMLVEAARSGDIEKVKRLLAYGGDADTTDKNGITVLMIAAYQGHTDVVRTLLENGASVNVKVKGGSALTSAALQGHLDIVKILMAAGAKESSANKLLMEAAVENQINTVRLYLSIGADVNAREDQGAISVLMLAAYRGYFDIVRALLERGADVDAKASNGATAVMYADSKGHDGIVRILGTRR